jgi:hypothetical protein
MDQEPSGLVSEEELERARAAEEVAARGEPRAATARYDAASDAIVIALRGGVAVSVPRAALAELREAAPADLARIEVYPAGIALRWPTLDVDISVPGLLRELFVDTMKSATA